MRDADARLLYELAGHDLDDPPGAIALARGLGLCVVRCVGLERSALLRSGEICVTWRASGARLAYLVAHELAEWHLRRTGYRGEDVEAQADALAARLVAPTPAVRRCVDHYGHDLPAVAEALATTQSVVALRIAEVYGRPTALVGPDGVRVRGEQWAWPADPRRLMRGPLPEGVERVPLTDSRRVVIRSV